MGRKAIDMVDMVFGKVKVIKRFSKYAETPVKWLCKCECGNEFVTEGSLLRRGSTRSCGCLQKELMSKRTKTHGMSNTRVHKTWSHMIERCTCKTHKQYSEYGGRGISVCDDWFSFETFYEWAMSNGYNDTLTIDRIDVNGNYEPNNCRWADSYIQQNNTRRTVMITINNITKSLSDWSKYSGIKKDTISSRYYSGIRGAALIEQPSKRKRFVR